MGNFLVPDKPEEEFEKNLVKLAASPLPILACNGFIRPANLHCIGPEANHDPICEWAETTFRRMKRASGKFIVFGSAGSRKLPDGWPKEKADEQFVALLKRLGPLAEAHAITVTVEQLRAEECNYINRIGEGATLIRAAGHPNIRLLADLYHMACAGDTPADLKAAMDVVVHVEIAEKEGRTLPGVSTAMISARISASSRKPAIREPSASRENRRTTRSRPPSPKSPGRPPMPERAGMIHPEKKFLPGANRNTRQAKTSRGQTPPHFLRDGLSSILLYASDRAP